MVARLFGLSINFHFHFQWTPRSDIVQHSLHVSIASIFRSLFSFSQISIPDTINHSDNQSGRSGHCSTHHAPKDVAGDVLPGDDDKNGDEAPHAAEGKGCNSADSMQGEEASSENEGKEIGFPEGVAHIAFHVSFSWSHILHVQHSLHVSISSIFSPLFSFFFNSIPDTIQIKHPSV